MFNENRNKLPAEELLKYAGQHVAWSRDGTRILAGDLELSGAIAKLQAAGFHSSEVVWSWVPATDTNSLLPSVQEIAGDEHGLYPDT